MDGYDKEEKLIDDIKLGYEKTNYFAQNFIILDSLCSWEGWLEYDRVANPRGRFSRYETQIIMNSNHIFQRRYFQSFPCQDKQCHLVTMIFDGCHLKQTVDNTGWIIPKAHW